MSEPKVYRKDVIKALSWTRNHVYDFSHVSGQMLYYMMLGMLSEVKDAEPSDSEKWHDITKKPCKMPLPKQEVIVKDTCGNCFLATYDINENTFYLDDEVSFVDAVKWHMIPEE